MAKGTLKIMVIADIQDDISVSPYTLKFIEAALASETPDLVIFNGDNIQGTAPSLIVNPNGVRHSISQFMEPIVKRDIPFALVFGNHDPQTIMSKEDQMKYYLSFANCLAEPNRIGGSVGNYNILIKNAQGKSVFNLWFFDSNSRVYSEYGYGYAYVTNEQLEWFASSAAQLTADNGNVGIPSIVFQHIPVPEIYDMLSEVSKGTQDAVEGHGRWKGHYFVANPEFIATGSLGEGPCPPDYNNGEFDRWIQEGNVKAAVFGHDHVNDFSGTYKNINMIYTPGVGFYSYGNGYKHGVRIIEINESDPENFSTRLIYFRDLLNDTIPDALLYDGEIPQFILQWVCIGVGAAVVVGLPIVILMLRRRKARRAKKEKKEKGCD
jgi:3',5'-cyclic AMP phosphodiesterase CpdA